MPHFADRFNAVHLRNQVEYANEKLTMMAKLGLDDENALKLSETMVKVSLADSDNHSVLQWQMCVTELMERIIRRDDPIELKDHVFPNGGFNG